jgi:hypothetical protein
MLFSLKIPVTDYQYQLLISQLGPTPYQADCRSYVGKLILSQYNNKAGVKRQIRYTESKIYEIDIPNRWVDRHGAFFISDESVADLIEFFDKQFKRKLYNYIESVMDFKEDFEKNRKIDLVAKMKDAACRFLDKNGMNEDLMKFETIKKGYQRYKLRSSQVDFISV